MAKFVVVLLCLTVIQAGLALKCKKCKEGDPQCKELDDETCAASPADKEAACLIFIYKSGNEEITDKKCVNRAKDGKYACIKTKTTDVEEKCVTCTTDFCNEKNSATRFSLGTLGVVGVVVAMLGPKFL